MTGRRSRVALVAVSAAAIAALRLQPVAAQGPCGGVGWTEITHAGAAIKDISSLSGGAGADLVYAGSRTGSDNVMLFSGSPASDQWQPEPSFTGIPVTDVLQTPGLPTQVWVSTFGDAPSFDGPVLGLSGAQPFTPRGSLRSWFMALAVSGSDVFVAASKPEDRGVYRWDQDTANWERLGGSQIDTVVFRAFEAGGDGRLWLGTDARGVWRSADAGATWQLAGAGNDWTVWSMAVSPTSPATALAGLGPPDGAVGVGGFVNGLWRTTDGGDHWTDVSPELLAGTADEAVTALALSPATEGLGFAAGWRSGLYVTRDGGATWAPYSVPGPEQRYYQALLVLPVSASCELLYAAGADGIWARNVAGTYRSVFLPAALRQADIAAR